MNSNTLPSTPREHGRKFNSGKVDRIVIRLTNIWSNSKENPYYTASLYKELDGLVSKTYIQLFKKVALERGIFICGQRGTIRFRSGIAKPNTLMVNSLLEEMRLRLPKKPKKVCEVKKPITGFQKFTTYLKNLFKHD